MQKGVPPMTTTVKLSKLTLSPINVRRRPDDLLEIPQMAADLEARGVPQNLLVTPVKKPRGTFEVFDGGRRLRSEEHTSELQSLMRISYAVFCLKKKKMSHIKTNRNTLITHHTNHIHSLYALI